MARKRVISPNIWTDEKFLQLPMEGRLFFIGLLNFADDDGIFINSSITLKCQIFPADNITLELLESYLNTMVGLKILEKGTDVDDNPLLKFKNWATHQKINHPTPTKYVFTPLIEKKRSPKVELTEDSRSTPAQYNINNINKDNINKGANEFAQVWKVYPKKKNKERSKKAYDNLKKKELDAFTKGLKEHVEYWSVHQIDLQFIPLLSTFINGKRYNDELIAPVEKKVFKGPLDEEIFHRNSNVANEGKRLQAYLKDAEEQADDIPNLLELKKEIDDDKPLTKDIERFMAKADSQNGK